MFKGSSDENSCISEIWYHISISCSTENNGNFILSHSQRFKNDHRILYVVSVRLLAKLWHNEFSWNHDRTYLLQVMVGTSFFVVHDHNQGPCATWDIYQKRILNSNHAKSRLPKYSLIISYRLNCFEMLYIAQRWLILTCTVGTKYKKHM